MGEKRATDHLEPAAKKRGSERQITKDDASDEEEQLEAGTFARASEDVLKQRKIIRARRGPTSGAPAAGSNPFANVQLAPTAGTATSAAPAAPANPFAGVSLVASAPAAAPAGPAAEATAAAETKEEEQKKNGEKAEEKPEVAPTEEEEAPKPAAPAAIGGFGAFGTSAAAAPAGGLAFGSSGGFGNVKTGTGGFGFLAASNAASAPGTSAFGASTTPAFGVSAAATATTTTTTTTTAAPAPASIFGSATISGTPAFGATATKPSIPDLPADVPVTTGEESENTVFSGTAVLFAFNPIKKEWTNRGSGGLKVNVNENTKQARMVMRQKDTLRLLLNANLWPGLNLTPQEGQSAMSFTCFNHVDGPSASEGAANKAEKDGGDGDGEKTAGAPTLETYAVKLKKADIPEFIEIVKRHMPKGAEGEEAA